MPLNGKTKEDSQGAVREKGVGKPLLEVAVDQTPYPTPERKRPDLRHSERPGARGGKRRRRRKAEGVENGKAALLKDDYRYKPGGKQNQGRVVVEAA